MDMREMELLESVVGELRVQRHRKDLDKFEKYPRLQKQLELALLFPTEEMRRKKLEQLMADLPETIANQIKAAFLDDFADYAAFVEAGKKVQPRFSSNEMPDSIRYALDKFESKLSEQVQKDVEARYASRLTEAKAKDALLPKGVNGRAQSPHQTSIEAEMIVEEHKLLANPSYKHKLAAEETRLVREYQRQQRAVNNPLVQVQK